VTSPRHAGRRCLVTGGASGIGAAMARRFVEEGARVAILDLRPVEGAELAIEADVAVHEQVVDAFEWIGHEWGGVDVLLNNAGISHRQPCLEVTPESWDRTIAVNLTGAFLCCRAAFTAMRPAGAGRIVTIASLSGVYATEKFPGLAAYNVSKYGVVGLTEAVAVEGRPHGISAICVSPGAVDTEMLRRANPDLRPGLTPADVADLIVALLDSPLAPASGANIPLFSNA
jgi:NAD(P)-dependent dehydrogenase (short-subunit alcohol dehydrogenase family)